MSYRHVLCKQTGSCTQDAESLTARQETTKPNVSLMCRFFFLGAILRRWFLFIAWHRSRISTHTECIYTIGIPNPHNSHYYCMICFTKIRHCLYVRTWNGSVSLLCKRII